MSKASLAFLLFGLIVAAVQGDIPGLPCCPALKNEVEELKLLVQYLLEKLTEQYQWKVVCPDGFTYLPLARRCYKVIRERHDWISAGKRCQGLHQGAQLVSILNEQDNAAVNEFIQSEIENFPNQSGCEMESAKHLGNMFWTSGQREVINECNSTFFWKPSSDVMRPLTYENWLQGEPNCGVRGVNRESCMDIWPLRNFTWNDIDCGLQICPVCQYSALPL